MSRLKDLFAKVAARVPPSARVVVMIALGIGSMVLLMVWLAGGFTKKIAPRERGALPPAAPGLPVIAVVTTQVPVVREVAGTIAAEHETNVASQLLGRVAAVHARAGARVTRGQVLVELEDAEQRARLQQADALLRQAQDHYQRIVKQHAAQAATDAQLVQARTAREAAQARVVEARTGLAKTRIRAPSDGVVIERLCEVGDTVTPGRTVVRLYDRLQLVATVPESLQPRLKVGKEVAVQVEALGKGECHGRITEIVPQAQALSRAFQVKVTGPCAPGLIPGMFGRLRIPLGTRRELRVPRAAIRRVGQIPMVFRVLEDGSLLRQFVRTGEPEDGQVPITSGLEPGDKIVAVAAKVTEAGSSQ